MTGHELARMLLTHADLPVRVLAVGVEGGQEISAVEAEDRVRLEIQTNRSGVRHIAVVANYDERSDPDPFGRNPGVIYA